MDTHSDLQTWILDSVHAQTFSTHACTQTHYHTHIHTLTSSLAWTEQAGSAAGQPVPLHISVIHPCHSGQDHEGGVEWWMEGKERLAWLTFNPHAVALCSPIASSGGHPPLPPHTHIRTHTTHRLLPLLYHLSPQAPVTAPPAWVSAKEDTWQRTDRPKAAWTPSDLAGDRGREGGRTTRTQHAQRVIVSKVWI